MFNEQNNLIEAQFLQLSQKICSINMVDFQIRLIFLKYLQMPLTKQRAQARFACIKPGSISYDFHLALESGNMYEGISEITFELLTVPNELALDFNGKQIKRLSVNNQKCVPKTQEGFILLDVTKLQQGENKVAVYYHNKYDNDASGLVSFTDVDKKQYLYTQFEAYYANRVFACFDQPDLKATMTLNVICPQQWKKVLSNEHATIHKAFDSVEYLTHCKTHQPDEVGMFLQGKDHMLMAIFPKTKLLPTYLFCMVAGDYQEIKIQHPYKNIPMSLYCIESLFEHLKNLAPFLFEVTVQCMKFFESFFGYPFSFNKYDQIFVHQYKWGAMENAGIVTFNDLYVWKEKVSTDRMLALANTVSHELAHHWFGNLVTMKWWDDLWLNQSFADFISHFCLEKIKNNLKTIHYESSMAAFCHRKGWGYHEDQRVTTHPIRGPVPNTSVADSIFDGITYAKGAATMKQLLYIMQQQNFSKALSEYFTQYAFSNARLTDFMAHMQKHFKIGDFTLDSWRQLWLEKASLNQLQVQWNPEDNAQDSKMMITQSAVSPDHPTLRPHKICIGLFKQDCSVNCIQTLIKPTEKNEVLFNASQKYKAVLLNYEDFSFVKIVIDKASMNFFSNNLDKIKDILSRTLIWRSFFDMLKDAQITSTQYIEVFTKNIVKEESDSIFEKQFDYIHAAINSYTPIKYRCELNEQLFNFTYNLLVQISEDKQNRIVILKNKLVSFARTAKTKHILLDWSNGKIQDLAKHQLTVGQRWATVVNAFTLEDISLQDKQAIFEAQRQKDPSDTSKLKRQTCDSIKANKEQFEKLYLSYLDPNNDLSTSMKQASMRGWNKLCHIQWLVQYKPRYFKDIVEASKTLKLDHLESFILNLEPIDDDLETTIARFEETKLQGDKFDKINTEIRKMVDDLKRRHRAYQLFLQNLNEGKL